MTEAVLTLLEESRRREKAQALFYRRLAARSGVSGQAALVDRFNDLHADEQHHLSRLTARVFELDGVPEEISGGEEEIPALDAWEKAARAREEAEVEWYRRVLEEPMDPETKRVFQEILESEEHHARELAGKWMSA